MIHRPDIRVYLKYQITSGAYLQPHPIELILIYEQDIESATIDVVCSVFLIKINLFDADESRAGTVL
jgi:hypothetical protein